jgi:hypothetical protein
MAINAQTLEGFFRYQISFDTPRGFLTKEFSLITTREIERNTFP